MAKELRLITASADLAKVVDRGAQVDSDIKTLTAEDKRLKADIINFLDDQFGEGETSLRFAGDKAQAVVTAAEKYTINSGALSFSAVRDAVNFGLLQKVVERKQELAIPPADIQRAANVLKKAGIPATIVESFSVDAAGYRAMSETDTNFSEEVAAQKSLKECVSREVTFRVKYEKK